MSQDSEAVIYVVSVLKTWETIQEKHLQWSYSLVDTHMSRFNISHLKHELIVDHINCIIIKENEWKIP